MEEKITVEGALKRGQLTVNGPVMAIILVSMFIVVQTANQNWPLSFVFLFGGPICAWFYWSFSITKWKLWAYARVDDLVALKKAAVRQNLIWPDGSIFNATEIKSKDEKLTEEKLLASKKASYVEISTAGQKE